MKPSRDAFWLRYSPALLIIIALGIFGLFLFSLPNPISLDDGIRHFTMAKFLSANGIGSVNGWEHFMYEGIFKTYDTDPWFLAEVLFIPLTGLPIAVALKIYSLIAIALVSGAFLLCIKDLKLSKAAVLVLLLLLLFGSTEFTGRMFLGRPFTVMTAVTLFSYYALRRNHPWILGALLLFATLYSQLFVFPLAFATAVLGWNFIATRKIHWPLLVAAVSGTTVGFLIHPTGLAYLQYLVFVFVRLPFLKELGLASELLSGVGNAGMVLVAVAAGVFLHLTVRQKKLALPPIVLALEGSVAVLLCMFLVWQRSIDVLWPLLVLLLAELVALDSSVMERLCRCLPEKMMPTVTLLFAGVLTIGMLTMLRTTAQANRANNLEEFRSDLADVPRGSRLLDLDWYWLPAYVAVRPDLQYATGIDAGFTYLHNPNASALIRLTTTASFERDEPIVDTGKWLTQLRQEYDGDYLVTSRRRYPKFTKQIENSGLKKIDHGGPVGVFELPKIAVSK